MKKNIISRLCICAILSFYLFSLNAQAPFIPVNLSLAMDSEYSEVNPVISVDGKTLFFSRVNHPENRYGENDSQDVWYISLQEDGTWSSAQRLPESVNIGRYNAILSALDDGRSYLILGQFNKRGTLRTSNGFSIIEKTGDNEWSIPQPVNVSRYNRISRGNVSSAYMTPDREIILHAFSTRHNRDRLSLHVSKRVSENNYSRPEKIEIGSYNDIKAQSLEAPFLTEDKNRLYFSANFGEDRDEHSIFYVDRVDETFRNWTAPTKVSDTVNTPYWDSYFKMNSDENIAWFSSTSGPSGKADIFMVKLFEKFPFLKVQGQIVDTLTGLPIPFTRNPEILINGELSDSVVYDYMSGSFHATLPLGESYTFTGRADNFKSKSVNVDVSSEELFTEKEIFLHLKSVPWVELSGNVLDNRSFTPISLEYRPRLIINGETVDSIDIDPVNGSFSVRLPFGRNYIMGVDADKYKTLDVKVDLTSYESFAAITQNVFAELMDVNMVTLQGRIINTKTGMQLEEGYDVRMLVNGIESSAFEYDTEKAGYMLRLPVGFNYDLIPRLINFYNRLETVDLTSAESMRTIRRDFYVTPLEIGQSVEIENIYFETGRAVLKPESFRSLNAIVEFLKEYPNVVLEIGGHTDNVGSAEVNQRISNERAFAVTEYVVSQGIGKERVVSKGYGFSKPIASNTTEEGRRRNRRVDFTIIGL